MSEDPTPSEDDRATPGDRESDDSMDEGSIDGDSVNDDSTDEESFEDESFDDESTDPGTTDPGTTDPETTDPGATDDHADVDDMPDEVPQDVQEYARFTKMDRADYDRVNEFLRDRTYITAREWAIARLCADFRTETGVEMTKIGANLPRLVPFMTDTYSPQAVNQARASFEEKVTKAGATFLYGAMSGFYTAEELDDTMYEVTEIAKFLLEVEGVDLSVEEELAAEDEISQVMRDVREASAEVRGEEVKCPECGHVHETE
jgi:hypothetical protein